MGEGGGGGETVIETKKTIKTTKQQQQKEVSNLEFKASVINTLRVLMEKVDSKQG